MGRTVCGRRVFNVCPDVLDRYPTAGAAGGRCPDRMISTGHPLDTRHAWRSEHLNDHTETEHVRPNDQPAR
jgi:hypothetical protein